VLSWDVGVKNLAYCILERNIDNIEDKPKTKHGFYIRDWGVINLHEDEMAEVKLCESLTKKGSICNKKTKLFLDDHFYCKTHSPLNSKLIKKPKKKLKSPFEYSKRMKLAFEKNPGLLNVDAVIIENQPSNLNPVMKTVQMLVFSYFSYNCESEKSQNLTFVGNINAKQKEKLPKNDLEWPGSENEIIVKNRYTKIKDPYKRRKILCLEYAKMCLKNCPKYLSHLENHSKQDDLSDCFLQATDWFLRNP
jgi:hypothetical protein